MKLRFRRREIIWGLLGLLGLSGRRAFGSVDSIELEYLDLKEDSFWRQCVEAAGVDNWGGMDYAHELMGGEDDD